MFEIDYVRSKADQHFHDAYEQVLLKWVEDNSMATKACALGGSRYLLLLQQSALKIGKDAIDTAFFTFLTYARDCSVDLSDLTYHLDALRDAAVTFIETVTIDLSNRFANQRAWGVLESEGNAFIVQLRTGLQEQLDSDMQDAVRGRHKDQQIVPPSVVPVIDGPARWKRITSFVGWIWRDPVWSKVIANNIDRLFAWATLGIFTLVCFLVLSWRSLILGWFTRLWENISLYLR